MNLFQIKICGITTPQDAIDAIDCEAEAIGLNFYQHSPRFVPDSAAQTIVNSIGRNQEVSGQSLPAADCPTAKLVGVFVNMPVPEMLQKTVAFNLDGIQLHGDEKPSIVAEIIQQFRHLDHQCELIRAVRTRPAHGNQVGGNGETDKVEAEITAWSDAGIDALLLDAAVPSAFGGTGKTVDWYAVPSLSKNVPLILAGGLNPGNVEKAIEISQVRAVDVASGVESEPGRKDREKVAAFVASARRALGR